MQERYFAGAYRISSATSAPPFGAPATRTYAMVCALTESSHDGSGSAGPLRGGTTPAVGGTIEAVTTRRMLRLLSVAFAGERAVGQMMSRPRMVPLPDANESCQIPSRWRTETNGLGSG